MTHYRSLSADWSGDKPRGCKCYREVGVLCNVCDDLADAKAAEIDGEEVRRGLADDRRLDSYLAAMLPPGSNIK